MSVTSGKSKVRHIASARSMRTVCGRVWTDVDDAGREPTCPECIRIQARGGPR